MLIKVHKCATDDRRSDPCVAGGGKRRENKSFGRGNTDSGGGTKIGTEIALLDTLSIFLFLFSRFLLETLLDHDC